jgi:hypothetical protein
MRLTPERGSCEARSIPPMIHCSITSHLGHYSANAIGDDVTARRDGIRERTYGGGQALRSLSTMCILTAKGQLCTLSAADLGPIGPWQRHPPAMVWGCSSDYDGKKVEGNTRDRVATLQL